MNEWISRARKTPFQHQVVGVERLTKLTEPDIGRTLPGCFFLTDEMGAGKTKQVIDAAQVLYERGEIDTVLVIAPKPVRDVWADPEIGELAKHLWLDVPSTIIELIRSRQRFWTHGPEAEKRLLWVVVNYEFARSELRGEDLFLYAGEKTLLVLDESSAVKSSKSLQTKAVYKLRKRCGRVILLNGTPISNSPADLYAQGHILDSRILNCTTFFQFRARYAVMGGFLNKQVKQWRNLEDIQQRFAPYVLRRLKKDCLDLPPKLDPITLTAELDDKTWALYKEMKDELIAWLDDNTLATAKQAVVKAMRLAQITSGFLGGLSDPDNEMMPIPPREVGREKLDVLLDYIELQLESDPNIKLMIWCRFRAELSRMHDVLLEKYPHVAFGLIWGGQKDEERIESLKLLKPTTAPEGPVFMLGTPASGSMGMDFSAAHTVIYASNDYSLKTRLQSEDRVHRPGQVYPVSYADIIATGPKGQKTIDHAVIKALHSKRDVADWTTKAWISALREE